METISRHLGSMQTRGKNSIFSTNSSANSELSVEQPLRPYRNPPTADKQTHQSPVLYPTTNHLHHHHHLIHTPLQAPPSRPPTLTNNPNIKIYLTNQTNLNHRTHRNAPVNNGKMKNTSAPRKKVDDRPRVKPPPLHPVREGERKRKAT
jgi:hypothetical protein